MPSARTITRSATNDDQVQSFARGLAVIRSFDLEHQRLSLAQISARAGLARATVRRLLHTLVSLNYAGTDGSEFWLTLRVLELGHSYLSSLLLPTVAKVHLEALSRRTNDDASMAVLDGADVVYVCRIAPPRLLGTSITVGSRFPAYSTPTGQVLLANLDDDALKDYLASTDLTAGTPRTYTSVDALHNDLVAIRTHGWALADQDHEVRVRSVAAPVHGPEGGALAAIEVATHPDIRTLREFRQVIVPDLLTVAQRIGGDLNARVC